jgi:hypothetical protein
VNLNAAGAQFAVVDEDQGVAEIGPETVAPGATVDDLHRIALGRL